LFDVLILGSSGQSRETLQLLRVLGLCTSASRVEFADDTNEPDVLLAVRDGGHAGPVALGIGRADIRLRVWDTWRRVIDRPWPSLVHPSAVIGDSTSIEEGAMVAAGTVTTCDVTVGPGSLINTNVSIGHDVVIGEAAVINPGATIGGGVTILRGALVGSGANIQEGRRIGAGAVVGSGAVVTRDVVDGEVVVGIPARVHGR
jgi:sugar O-acyltransferase (sialic acid O-acetyltransferase NeuD family)